MIVKDSSQTTFRNIEKVIDGQRWSQHHVLQFKIRNGIIIEKQRECVHKKARRSARTACEVLTQPSRILMSDVKPEEARG